MGARDVHFELTAVVEVSTTFLHLRCSDLTEQICKTCLLPALHPYATSCASHMHGHIVCYHLIVDSSRSAKMVSLSGPEDGGLDLVLV